MAERTWTGTEVRRLPHSWRKLSKRRGLRTGAGAGMRRRYLACRANKARAYVNLHGGHVAPAAF
jgi:hypothetical protein